MTRVLSITQARSLYLKRAAEAKQSGSGQEQEFADREVKKAARVLQQAQLTARLGSQRRSRVVRPSDWNVEST